MKDNSSHAPHTTKRTPPFEWMHIVGAVAVVITAVAVGSFVVHDTGSHNTTTQNEQENIQQTATVNAEHFFTDVPLEAKSVYVWDADSNQVIHERNPRAQLPLASLSKVMTALVALEIADDETTVVVTDENLLAEGDNGLFGNESWYLRDILDFTLIESSNDGARAVASAIEAFPDLLDFGDGTQKTFMQLMNEKARDIGMRQTYFLNPSGLDIDEQTVSGSYGSARDIALLFDHILETNPSLLEATQYRELTLESLDNFSHTAENTNKLVNDIPFLIGSKTGFTDLAGGNLAVAFDVGLNHPVIITVLGSTREGRFDDVKKLYEATVTYFTAKQQ